MCWPLFIQAQDDYHIRNKGNALLAHMNYGYQVPGGDLVDRFGSTNSAGVGLEYITDERNWIFDAKFDFMFGIDVKEDVLFNLRTYDEGIIANDKNFADILLRERAFFAGLSIGKIVPLSQVNKRAGIKWSLGAGLLQHKIRIQDDPDRDVPELLGAYKKGYDRLTNGLSLQEFIGYQQLGLKGRLNFYAGFEFTQAFTQNRRSYNFDTMMQDTQKRIDLMWGVKVGWILPFYLGRASNTIFY